MPFAYKTVLVTGATSGIGRALAEQMADSGVFVIAVGRRAGILNDMVAAHGADRMAAEPYDVTDLAGMAEWTTKSAISTLLPFLASNLNFTMICR
jgi:NADP-dependent 3-hydroxy acid dehydrogenase YdfG